MYNSVLALMIHKLLKDDFYGELNGLPAAANTPPTLTYLGH